MIEPYAVVSRVARLIVVSLIPAVLAAQEAPSRVPTIVPVPATPLPRTHEPQPTVADITAADLMTRLYIFADDSMQGREAGTIGDMKGTDYIAHEAQLIGLQPAGDSGTYFQTIPLVTRTLDSSAAFVIDGKPLVRGVEWAGQGAKSISFSRAKVVFGGTSGDTAHMIPVGAGAGKIVVFRIPAGAAANVVLGKHGQDAGAVVLVGLDQFIGYLSQPSSFLADSVSLAANASQPTLILVASAASSKIFGKPLDRVAPGAVGKPVSLTMAMRLTPAPYPARNVVGILPGSDPTLKAEYVALGAHNDHIGIQSPAVDHDSIRIFDHIVRTEGAEDAGKEATPDEQSRVNAELAAWRSAHPGTSRRDSIANGADDDGTGSVALLEIAQKIASLPTRPKRSMLFVWHVGEEKGLLGSTYFTDHPTIPRDSIMAQLNIDMIGRGDAWDVTGTTKDGQFIHGSPNYLQVVGSRRRSTELGDLVERVNTDGQHGLQFDYSLDADGHPLNIYCRSDHYEYARYGIPIVFFTTGGHSDYHQVTDEPEYIDYDHMTRVANFIEDLAVRTGNLDHWLALDHPKPDPTAACQQ